MRINWFQLRICKTKQNKIKLTAMNEGLQL